MEQDEQVVLEAVVQKIHRLVEQALLVKEMLVVLVQAMWTMALVVVAVVRLPLVQTEVQVLREMLAVLVLLHQYLVLA
jgi:hypothetical protein